VRRFPIALAVVAGSLAATACGGSSSATPDGGRGDGGHADAGLKVDSAASDVARPLPPLESAPPPLIPQARRQDAASSPILFDPVRQVVWTANTDVGSVSYVGVNHGDQRVLEEIHVGSDVRSVALSPDGAWLAAVDRGGAQVALIDAGSRVVRRLIAVGTHPRSALWDAANPRWLYVTLEDDGAVAVIDRTLGVLKATVPVGRIPAGLAVSATHEVLYVTHRIDPMVTTVSLPGLSVLGNVMLADQPAASPATVPQGMPFAFDSVAWTYTTGPDGGSTGGSTMWIPHELLAPTHPFQFTETLFPAISVVDFSGAGDEVETDPNDPNGVIAGRKLLFGAINLLDATGNVAIVSQPCAVVMHPNGLTAYALACASDDLLTFDMTQGIAVDVLRNLPGSHPVGIAIQAQQDSADGSFVPARAFVVSDQSHTLLTVDLGGGSPIDHATITDGSPPRGTTGSRAGAATSTASSRRRSGCSSRPMSSTRRSTRRPVTPGSRTSSPPRPPPMPRPSTRTTSSSRSKSRGGSRPTAPGPIAPARSTHRHPRRPQRPSPSRSPTSSRATCPSARRGSCRRATRARPRLRTTPPTAAAATRPSTPRGRRRSTRTRPRTRWSGSA